MNGDHNIVRLTYLSSASGLPGEQDLEQILVAARQKNQEAGVTGLLLYHDGSFFQSLEGKSEAVDKIYTSIEQDSRHSGCIILERKTVPERLFSDWAMAFKSNDELGKDQREAFRDL